MGWFGSKTQAGEKAKVKVFKKDKKHPDRSFGFLTLPDGKEVYFNQKHLNDAKIREVTVGMEITVVTEPSTKKPGTLQAKSLSA